MSQNVRKRGSDIRNYLLTTLSKSQSPITISELSAAGAKKFGISQAAIAKHVRNLAEQGSIELTPVGRTKLCSLKPIKTHDFSLSVQGKGSLDEMDIYLQEVKPVLANLCDSARNILEYGFTEMMNNVIDHSSATRVHVLIEKTAITTSILIADNGVGIFKKVKDALHLSDERQALLELSKGKFTTDPTHHTGEGIFFTSRACDEFAIFSGGLVFAHSSEYPRDFLTRWPELNAIVGTLVRMSINNNSARRLKSIFKRYSSVDGGFTKTEVPLKLMQYQNEGLVSRSQAKRLLERVDRFKFVTLDFENIEFVGQAFADQIFRVFAKEHPDVEIKYRNANKDIEETIKIAQANATHLS